MPLAPAKIMQESGLERGQEGEGGQGTCAACVSCRSSALPLHLNRNTKRRVNCEIGFVNCFCDFSWLALGLLGAWQKAAGLLQQFISQSVKTSLYSFLSFSMWRNSYTAFQQMNKLHEEYSNGYGKSWCSLFNLGGD